MSRPIGRLALVMSLALAGCSTTDHHDATTPRETSGQSVSTQATARSTPSTGASHGAYVSLGDSYAAGMGIAPTDPDASTACRRSSNDLGHLIAARGGYTLTDAACSGAETSNLAGAQTDTGARPQLAALTSATRLVTVMIGGNDRSVFGRAVGQCGKLGFNASGKGSPCRHDYGTTFDTTIRTTTYPALVTAFAAVKAKAPRARVVAVGYPRLLPAGAGCFPAMPLADGDVAYLDGIERTLNSAVERATKATGVTYVDAYAASSGHDACAGPDARWVEPVIGGRGAAAHPNARGEAALTDLVLTRLREH